MDGAGDGDAVLRFLLGGAAAVKPEVDEDARSASSSSSCAPSEAGDTQSQVEEEEQGEADLPTLEVTPIENEDEGENAVREEDEDRDAATDRESTEDGDDAGLCESSDEGSEDCVRDEQEGGASRVRLAPAAEPEVETEGDGADCLRLVAHQHQDEEEEVAPSLPTTIEHDVIKSARITEEPADGVEEQIADEKRSPSEEGEPSMEELATVGIVAVALMGYVLACFISYWSRDLSGVIHLPNASQFESPVDLSNVSLRILHPPSSSVISTSLIRLEWQLEDFPADALRQHGPEAFQYDIIVNNKRWTSEMALLELTESEEADSSITAINRSVTHYLPSRKLLQPEVIEYFIRVDVRVTVPGSFDQVTTLSNVVVVSHPKPVKGVNGDDSHVQITVPVDGTKFRPDEDIVVQYAVGKNVLRLRVQVDDALTFWKARVDDGVLFLTGLCQGRHLIHLHAFSDFQAHSIPVSSASIHVLVQP